MIILFLFLFKYRFWYVYNDFLYMCFNILYSIFMWYLKFGCFGFNLVGFLFWEIFKIK